MDQLPPEGERPGMAQCSSPAKALVKGVNDASARFVEDFQVTRYELEVLARYYLEDVRDVEFKSAAYMQSGSDSTRRSRFGAKRLDSIERILGADVLAKALATVEEKWRRQFDDLKVYPEPVNPDETLGGIN